MEDAVAAAVPCSSWHYMTNRGKRMVMMVRIV
jgi:hypothetical protein